MITQYWTSIYTTQFVKTKKTAKTAAFYRYIPNKPEPKITYINYKHDEFIDHVPMMKEIDEHKFKELLLEHLLRH